MTEIIQIPLTPEQIAEREAWEAAAPERAKEAVDIARRNAYAAEADPLNFKWQETQLEEDRVAWLEKKNEIKERYPNPSQEIN